MPDFIYDVLSVQFSLSHVQLFVTPWTAACQASLSITNSRSLPKLMSVMPSPLSRWCHLTISSSPAPFCLGLQSFPVSGLLHIMTSADNHPGIWRLTQVLNRLSVIPWGWVERGHDSGLLVVSSPPATAPPPPLTFHHLHKHSPLPSLICFRKIMGRNC